MDYEYSGSVVRVIDGDTIIAYIEKEFSFPLDFGFNIKDVVKLNKSCQMTFRIAGINAPEITGALKLEGLKSKEELERLLKLGSLRIVSHKQDKYGRWLADIYVQISFVEEDGSIGINEINVGSELIKNGFAQIYK